MERPGKNARTLWPFEIYNHLINVKCSLQTGMTRTIIKNIQGHKSSHTVILCNRSSLGQAGRVSTPDEGAEKGSRSIGFKLGGYRTEASSGVQGASVSICRIKAHKGLSNGLIWDWSRDRTMTVILFEWAALRSFRLIYCALQTDCNISGTPIPCPRGDDAILQWAGGSGLWNDSKSDTRLGIFTVVPWSAKTCLSHCICLSFFPLLLTLIQKSQDT